MVPALGEWQFAEGIDKMLSIHPHKLHKASLVAQMVKNPLAMQRTWVRSLGQEDPLKEGMATHSRILAWRTPWTKEPGRLQFIESQRAGHDVSNLAHMYTGRPLGWAPLT